MQRPVHLSDVTRQVVDRHKMKEQKVLRIIDFVICALKMDIATMRKQSLRSEALVLMSGP